MSAMKALIELTSIFFAQGLGHARRNLYTHASLFEAFTVRLRAQVETDEFIQHELMRFETSMGMDMQNMIAVAFLQFADTKVHIDIFASDFTRMIWRDILTSISPTDMFSSDDLTGLIKKRVKLHVYREYMQFLKTICVN